MRNNGILRGSARGVCALLGAASIFALPGCDLADSAMALVRKSAEGAIQDKADEVVRGAIDGVLGNVLPESM